MIFEHLNIIGDVAGQHKTLLALVKKMPAAPIALLGDLIDRGPRSREVVAWAKESAAVVLKGNHEHMMVHFALRRFHAEYRESETWFLNGGDSTVRSYYRTHDSQKRLRDLKFDEIREHLKEDALWLDALPIEFEQPGLYLSHAPVPGQWRHRLKQITEFDRIWNRYQPSSPWEGKFFVHGHNSRKYPLFYGGQQDKSQAYGANIDTSNGNTLTGLHWPSMEVFNQEYL